MDFDLASSHIVENLFRQHNEQAKKLKVPEQFELQPLNKIEGDIAVEFEHFKEKELQFTHSSRFRFEGPKTGLDEKYDKVVKLKWKQTDREIVTGKEEEVDKKREHNTFWTQFAEKYFEIFV